ncbi:MAG: hypothetical protein ACE5H1_10175, partial [Thermodesulfobacteriota bacterium]
MAINTDISKALIGRLQGEHFYAVKDEENPKNVIDLGFSPSDLEEGTHSLVGRYALFITRLPNSFTFKLLDKGITSTDAQAEAIDLVENNRNNILQVAVGKGVPQTFANRAIFKGVVLFFRISKTDLDSDEGDTELQKALKATQVVLTSEEFSELEKAGTEPQSILFPKSKFSVESARSWLKSHNRRASKVDSPANFHRFRQFDPSECASTPKTISFGESGIKAVICTRKSQDTITKDIVDDWIRKQQPDITDTSDVHVDSLVNSMHIPSEDKKKREKEKEKNKEKNKITKSSAIINNLPDSAFAFIESGGKKDATGKTVPRSLRHFPVHDPSHTRNALARVNQSPFGKRALPKILVAAKKFGIKVSKANSNTNTNTS